MDLPVTLSLLGLAVVMTAFCGWRGARLPNPLRGPRMIPWRMLMLLAGAVTLGLAAHALALMGIGAKTPGVR